jgi:predicted ATPase/DNA-binding winged helix-turn-helix (wHTH) protein
MPDQIVSFGPFRLLPAQQLLLEGDRPVRLGHRAREILIALINRPGQVVTKEELIASAWQNIHVEEGSLRVHVAALRRALGDGQGGRRYVMNVPGRGYAFVAPIGQNIAPDTLLTAQPHAREPDNLPVLGVRVIGRTGIIRAISAQLPLRRLTTLVGPGGIGKTTVAVAVASEVAGAYADGVRFVDFAPITDPTLVTTALAFVLGVPIRTDNPLEAVVGFLKQRQMLIVLDSCEHVIEDVAHLAEQIVGAAPGVHLLATSREPLRAREEQVQRLSPLEIPVASEGLNSVEALKHSAVELFVDRAGECLDRFEITDADAPIVCEICRRLDGIPLAIELAASRVDSFSVKELANRLNNRFQLLTRGRRTAPPRHQTLAAVQDWSYTLLPEPLRVVLRRLSVFAGWFTSESAIAVVSSDTLPASDVIGYIADLIAKSFIIADVDAPRAYYRLLDTTKVYASQKLKEADEFQLVSRSHANHFRLLFERAESEWETRSTAEWLADYIRQVDNLRAALDWAFSSPGDKSIGVALTVAAVPLWFQLSLINECRERVEFAIAARDPHASLDAHCEMKLHAALGWSLMYTPGHERPTGTAWRAALESAQNLGDVDYQLRALWGLWAVHYNNGEYREALVLAERFSALAASSTDAADPHIADRMIGVALHFLGDQTDARWHIERMLARYATPSNRSHIVRFQFEQRVTARTTLVRALWLQGFADQALGEVERNIDEAVAIEHTLTLCNALANGACPVALLAGDLIAAERYTAMLTSLTERHALEIWHTFADIFRGELLARSAQVDRGMKLLHDSIAKLRNARFAQHQTAFLRVLAEGAVRAGQLADALVAINEALLQCEQTDERWCMSELLRIKGEIALRDTATDGAVVAEKLFLEALDWARRQQALSWELRSATSLAQLWCNHGRVRDARNLLAPVYNRLTEGHQTADPKAARSLLDQLG